MAGFVWFAQRSVRDFLLRRRGKVFEPRPLRQRERVDGPEQDVPKPALQDLPTRKVRKLPGTGSDAVNGWDGVAVSPIPGVQKSPIVRICYPGLDLLELARRYLKRHWARAIPIP